MKDKRQNISKHTCTKYLEIPFIMQIFQEKLLESKNHIRETNRVKRLTEALSQQTSIVLEECNFFQLKSNLIFSVLNGGNGLAKAE